MKFFIFDLSKMFRIMNIHLKLTHTTPINTKSFIIGNMFELYRGSYMSAHVLFILLTSWGKRDKMQGLRSILSLFRNEFNKFNYTRARM